MKLIRYSKSEGGGMLGGSSSIDVQYTSDGQCLFTSHDKVMHSEPTYVKKYYAKGLLDKIGEVCEKYHINEWGDLPDSQIFMHDAATICYTFEFEDGTIISFGTRKNCPDTWIKAREEIKELIALSEEYGTDVETDVELSGPGGMMGMMGMMMGGMSMMDAQRKELAETLKQQKNDESDSNWSKFCGQCGAKMEGKFCPECGAPRKRLE